VVIVEGAGGLMSPISDDDYNADLAEEFGYPLVIVAANQLGTINATLQTLIAANSFRESLRVAGVVLNSPFLRADDPSTASNRDELVRRCKVPLLAEVEHGGEFDQLVDWWKLAGE
jgi:dethiobiotin synthetase